MKFDPFLAVRKDRMRGGRNKFGSMYKKDRARRMQIYRTHSQPYYHHPPPASEQIVSSSTQDLNGSNSGITGPYAPHQAPPGINGYYNCGNHVTRGTSSSSSSSIASKRGSKLSSTSSSSAATYHGEIQSPTLSSTHSPTDSKQMPDSTAAGAANSALDVVSAASSGVSAFAPYGVPNFSGTYTPNCESLSALLSSAPDPSSMAASMDSLRGFTQSMFATNRIKPEPFEYDPYHFGAAADYTLYPTLGGFASLTNANPFMPTGTGFDFGSALPPAPSAAVSSSTSSTVLRDSFLPVCAVPNSKAFLTGGSSSSGSSSPAKCDEKLMFQTPPEVLLQELSKGLPDEKHWQSNLYNLILDESCLQRRVDLFQLMCDVIDHSLFAQVDWARATPYFQQLQV